MIAVFIRHGSAEPASAAGDVQPGLTPEGRREVRATAEALKAIGLRLDRVFTSPLRRAVESAQAVSEVHKGAPVEPVDGLAPPGDAAGVADLLRSLPGSGASAVGLVGHTPALERCIAELISPRSAVAMSLSKAGAACVDVPPAGSSDRPELLWLMRGEQLAAIARAGQV